MGQCHYCGKAADMNSEEKDITPPSECIPSSSDRRCSDSALDYSDVEEDQPPSCQLGHHLRRGGSNRHHSSSSESSGKYSFRDSSGSFYEVGQQSPSKHYLMPAIRTTSCGLEIPSYPGSSNVSQDSLQLPREKTSKRKVSWGSAESDCGSRTSLNSDTNFIETHMKRSTSLRSEEDTLSLKTSKTSQNISLKKRIRRTVSLRLYRSRYSKGAENKLPTIYVEDLPGSNVSLNSASRKRGSKSSLNQALSLLSLNTLHQREKSEKPEKPVQKILRPPTRRHTKVRGMSGLAIDYPSQYNLTLNGLNRSQTLYYPTNTTMKQTTRRRTYT